MFFFYFSTFFYYKTEILLKFVIKSCHNFQRETVSKNCNDAILVFN